MTTSTGTTHTRIFTLNEPTAPRLNPALACEIGLNESLLLLQLEFWISITDNERDGHRWTYQSTRDIQSKAFPFWSVMTINRAIKSLETAGYIVSTTEYNSLKYDKTRWFRLNFEKLSELKSIAIQGYVTRSDQNGTGSSQSDTGSDQDGTTIPETTTEISTDDVPEPDPPLEDKQVRPSSSHQDEINDIITEQLIFSIPEAKRSNATVKIIEKALLSLSVDEVRTAIAYTLINSKGNKSAFKAYLSKCLENGWYEGYEPDNEAADKEKAFIESRRQMPDSVLKYEAEVRGCTVCAQILQERNHKK